jgi:DNA invertase Pin-like site-specific DNA recombinase
VVDAVNTSTAAGRLQMHILAAMAQFSSDLLSERMCEVNAIRRLRQGKDVPSKPAKMKWDSSEWVAQRGDSPAATRLYGVIYSYERVSSVSQYTSGLSLENQSAANEAYIRRHCVATGAVIGEVFREDAISAFSVRFDQRPEGKRLLEKLKPGDDVVIYRSDRAFRHPGDALEICKLIKEKGAFVHLVSECIRSDVGSGMDWIGILSAVAHLESTLKSRRVREAHDACRRQGRPIGQIKKGYKSVVSGGKKKLAIDEAEVARCAAVWIARNEMNLSINETTDVIVALKCEAKNEKATLRKYGGHSCVKWHTDYAERLQEELPPSLWEKAMTQARERISRPISKKFWICPSWAWPGGVAV